MIFRKDSKTKMLEEYSPKIFNELTDFFASREDLKKEENCISNLGSIICKYRLNDMIGIGLLHKHFDILNNEFMVRIIQGVNRATIQPSQIDDYSSNVIPYLWKYVSDENGSAWYPLEFIIWDEEYCAELEILKYADSFLLELGEVLVKSGLENIFGIVGLYSRRFFSIDPDETVIEFTDESNKILTLESQFKSSVDNQNSTKTLWVFDSPTIIFS